MPRTCCLERSAGTYAMPAVLYGGHQKANDMRPLSMRASTLCCIPALQQIVVVVDVKRRDSVPMSAQYGYHTVGSVAMEDNQHVQGFGRLLASGGVTTRQHGCRDCT